jgi:hypothetical protein
MNRGLEAEMVGMSLTLQEERDKWGKGRAHLLIAWHLIFSPWIAELSISKGDLLFSRRAVYQTGGAEVSDEPGIEQSDDMIESIHAILTSEGREWYPLIKGLVKCRKVIKCVILRASWYIASRRVRVRVELQQEKCTNR